jgi:hypothetical protein
MGRGNIESVIFERRLRLRQASQDRFVCAGEHGLPRVFKPLSAPMQRPWRWSSPGDQEMRAPRPEIEGHLRPDRQIAAACGACTGSSSQDPGIFFAKSHPPENSFRARLQAHPYRRLARRKISISFFQNSCLSHSRPVSHEGVSQSSRTSRRDAVGVLVLQRGFPCRRTATMRTVKSRGPDTPTLVSSAMCASALSRYGGQKARRTGENAKQPLKPSRGEGRVFRLVPVVPAACIFFRRRAMGAASIRPSLRLCVFRRRDLPQSSGAKARRGRIVTPSV